MRRRAADRATALAGALALVLVGGTLTGCIPSLPEEAARPPTGGSTEDPVTSEPRRLDLDLALSTPVEDSVYPDVGGPDVDALLYELRLRWRPPLRRLTGRAAITFRAARSARRFTLDLSTRLTVSSVRLDGRTVRYRQRGDEDLVVRAPIRRDERRRLVVRYSGTPRPTPAPTTRGDFSTTGFTVTKTGAAWTMQEPYGAYTWYPVNDQPADKALYDISITVPKGWTGVANGRLVSDANNDATHTTRWQLDEPASSYLITLAMDEYEHASNKTRSGLTVSYWFPKGDTLFAQDMAVGSRAIDWIEERLGPYPFSTAGIVATDSESAMETQTMVTIGDNDYVRSEAVIRHELVHQWYGDMVSPADWSDVWLNEGMTMLLQAMWESEQTGHPEAAMKRQIRDWLDMDADLRRAYGPPGDYKPGRFGGSNIYYIPAVMWNQLRVELGDDEFFRIARGWLDAHDNTSVTREQVYEHWSRETGRDLTAYFEGWIEGYTMPAVPSAAS